MPVETQADRGPLFCDQEQWKDVMPLEQYKGNDPIAPICYTEGYEDATGYFRAIVKTGEKSPRVLALTESIIRQNPAHYTAWRYRYETIVALNAPLNAELAFTNELASAHLKTYQIWNYRRLLVSKNLQTPEAELAFVTACLRSDAKNYHTWSYRQWVLAHFFCGGGEENERKWAEELEFVDGMIGEDVRNNSAWHHRFSVVWARVPQDGNGGKDKEELIGREVGYTKEKISLAPHNPSPWNYLRGTLEFNNVPFSSVVGFIKPLTASPISSNCQKNPGSSSASELPVPLALEFLADIYENECGNKEDGLMSAIELWKSLADDYDVIHRGYWGYRIRAAITVLQQQARKK